METNDMTTKEKVVRESFARASKRLKTLEDIMNASPAVDLIDVRREAQQLLEDNKGIEKRTSKYFMDKIEALSKREKDCWKMINRQKNWMKDSDEMVKLQIELGDLKNELFHIERNKQHER
jgi:hypothetical protein